MIFYFFSVTMGMGATEICNPNCDLHLVSGAPELLSSLSSKAWQVQLLPSQPRVVGGAIHSFRTSCLQPWPALIVNKSTLLTLPCDLSEPK